jgi:mono/diheme cytochrome c family protein
MAWIRGAFLLSTFLAAATSLAGDEDAARRGYRHLVDTPYLVPDFHQEDFDHVWQVWPEQLRQRAEQATPDERRRLAFRRYGLTPRPDDPVRPLQYVVDDKGGWTMNCFACHGGEVAGKVVPGLPNQRFALETLTQEIAAIKKKRGRPFGRMEAGALTMPLGTTRGTTNSVVFGIVLMNLRDKDLNYRPKFLRPEFPHHDMDAPPWWHFKRRKTLYIDGFVGKDHRPLMTFMLIPTNSGEKLRGWESDYEDVLRYVASIEAPEYPWEVDAELAARGRRAYKKTCARCHGDEETYEERVVPIDELGTDPVRLRALTRKLRSDYGASWIGRYGKTPLVAEPEGYVAPPLDGVWASAPYFHNGSVPTLWHVLHPDERPVVWRRKQDGDYDRERVGLAVEELKEVPETDAIGRREYFDTRAHSKSAAGHPYPDELSAADKRAVLEYLKTR